MHRMMNAGRPDIDGLSSLRVEGESRGEEKGGFIDVRICQNGLCVAKPCSLHLCCSLRMAGKQQQALADSMANLSA